MPQFRALLPNEGIVVCLVVAANRIAFELWSEVHVLPRRGEYNRSAPGGVSSQHAVPLGKFIFDRNSIRFPLIIAN